MNKFARFVQGDPASLTLSRRGFLIGSASIGVTLAFTRATLADGDAGKAAAQGLFEPTVWYTIDRDGLVTVNVAEAEMGQHVGTSLARIIADELEADWSKVRLKHVDSDPKWGYMVTGGSWSIWSNFVPLSRAGAAGRMALIDAGAALMQVPAADCYARNGCVHHGDEVLTYGEIVTRANLNRAYSAEELEKIAIKKPAERRLIGHASRADDIPAKVDGSARYGIDAEVEGMIYARPLLPPTRYGSSVKSIDDKAATKIDGYIDTLALEDPSDTVPGWVVVLANSYHAANRAAAAVKVKWNAGPTAKVSENDIQEHARKLIGDASVGSLVIDDEGVDEAMASGDKVLDASYTTSTALHFQMEPLNALAFQKDGRWEIHTGNQWQSLILPTLATALAVPEDRIVMRTYMLGGGFGRRLNGDYTVPAALAAKATGKPVKMVMSRDDDARFDSVRSPSVQRLRIAFDKDKKVTAMEHHAAAGWPTQVLAPGFMPKGKNDQPYDPFSTSGADHWYTVGAHRVRVISNDLAMATFRPGWLRSVGPGWINWALESFLDEAAQSQGLDPVAFRLSMLKATGKNAGEAPNSTGGASRQANVLRKVAQMANWGSAKLPKDSGLGIATSFGQERGMPTWVACVAQVQVDRRSGRVRCEKLHIATDAGTIIHPDGALAQTEGAALWGVSLALHEGTRFEKGQVNDTNLNSYTPLRMQDVPAMDIAFVDSTENPVGLGEPATTVVGPAIGNAIFAATGARVRDLPITPESVRKALQQA